VSRKKKKKLPKINQIDIIKSIRRIWNINPVTRVIPNKKKRYDRKQEKDIKKEEYKSG